MLRLILKLVSLFLNDVNTISISFDACRLHDVKFERGIVMGVGMFVFPLLAVWIATGFLGKSVEKSVQLKMKRAARAIDKQTNQQE